MWEKDVLTATSPRLQFCYFTENIPLKKQTRAPLKQRHSARVGERHQRVLEVQIVTVLCLLERSSITTCYLPVTCTHSHTHPTHTHTEQISIFCNGAFPAV